MIVRMTVIIRVMVIMRRFLTMPMPMVRVDLMAVLEFHRHTWADHVDQGDRNDEKAMEQGAHRNATIAILPSEVGGLYLADLLLQGK